MLGPGRWEGRVSPSVSSGLLGSVNLVTCLNRKGQAVCLGEPRQQKIRQILPTGNGVLSSPEVSSNTSAFYESGSAVTTMNLVH